MAMDDFFRVAPSVSAGLRQGFSDIQSILQKRDEIDQMYRNQDLRRLEQGRDLSTEFVAPEISTTVPTTYVGLREPTSPLAYAKIPGIDLGTYEVPTAAPAATTPTAAPSTDGAAAADVQTWTAGTPTKTPKAGTSVTPRTDKAAQPTTGFPGLATGPSNRLVDRMRTGTTADPTAPITAADLSLFEKAFPTQTTTQTAADVRSVRNNNPGNLRFTPFSRSLGATGQDKDGFAIFPNAQVGNQASLALLQNYAGKGRDTVSAIINNWSPPNGEGNTPESTKNYINYVSQQLGVKPTDKLDMANPQVLASLNTAIAKFEGGSQAGQVVVDNTGKVKQGTPAITPPPVNPNNWSAQLPTVEGAPQPTAADVKGVDDQLQRALTMTPREHDVETEQLLRSRQLLDNQTRETQAIAARQYQFAVQNAQRVQAERNGLLERARMAQRVGNITDMNNLLQRVSTMDAKTATDIQGAETAYRTATMEVDAATKANYDKIDNELWYKQGLKGITMLNLTGDVRAIEAVWSNYTGQEIRLQPRTDGKYNIWVPQNGQLKPVIDKQTNTAIGFDKGYIQRQFLSTINEAYRLKDAEARQKTQETQLKFANELKMELVKGINAVDLENTKQLGAQVLEQIKQNGKVYEVKVNQDTGEITGFAFINGSPVVIKVDPKDVTDGKFKPESVKVVPIPLGLQR